VGLHDEGPSREAQCVPARVHTKEFDAMALDESAMTDLLAALRAGGGLDVVRGATGPDDILALRSKTRQIDTRNLSLYHYGRGLSIRWV
jgi:hypothetical protein